MDNETEVQSPSIHTLIPLGDFNTVFGIDDRDETMARFCLVTATYTIEQYYIRRLFLKRHFERIACTGDPLLALREYPVREVLAVCALDDIGGTGEILEPEL